MKKLKRLSLKCLENEMSIIDEKDSRKLLGGWDVNNLNQIGSSTTNYNCHSYSWSNGQGDPTDPNNILAGLGQGGSGSYGRWDNSADNNVSDFFDDGGAQFGSCDAMVGDKMIYYVDSNNNNYYDEGESIVHSADITEVGEDGRATEVTSKWGAGGLYESDPDIPVYQTDNGLPTGNPTKTAVLGMGGDR